MYDIFDLYPPPNIVPPLPSLPRALSYEIQVGPPPLTWQQRLNAFLVNNKKAIYAFAGTVVLLALFGGKK